MSEINPFVTQDYLLVARDRVTEQFRDKVVFDKYLQLLLAGDVELQQTLQELMQLRSIDTATGVQLDIIGEIVGQPRELIDTDLIDYFGFAGYPTAGPFGDLSKPSQGSPFFNLGDPTSGNTLLNDEQYRLFIKARILKNSTTATPEEFLTFISFVFGVPVNNLIAEGDAEFTVLIGRNLTAFERTLLTYTYGEPQGAQSYFVIKPVGVKINFGEFSLDDFFAFQGVAGAKGFGDDPSTGFGSGYGLNYGANYGGTPTLAYGALYDGTYEHDGEAGYATEEPVPENVGGVFATLFTGV